MLKIVKVREYMSADLICLAPDADLAKAIDVLVRYNSGTLPLYNASAMTYSRLKRASTPFDGRRI